MKTQKLLYIALCIALMALSSFLTAVFVKQQNPQEDFDQSAYDDQLGYERQEEILSMFRDVLKDREDFVKAAQNELEHYGVSGEVVNTASHATEDFEETDCYQILKDLHVDIYLDDRIVVYSKSEHIGGCETSVFSMIYCADDIVDLSTLLEIDHYIVIQLLGSGGGSIYFCMKNPPCHIYL